MCRGQGATCSPLPRFHKRRPRTRSRATVSGAKLCEFFHEDDLVRPMKRLVGLRAEPVLPRVPANVTKQTYPA
jgi:hypothetical protein